jgi:hypothetical protein
MNIPENIKHTPIPEAVWKLAEKAMIRRERQHRVRTGVIVPAYGMKPQMMVKDANGRWCPELVIHRA